MYELESLSAADYYVVAVYMVIMLVVGVLVAMWNKDADDYFKGGNKLPYWLAGLSLFMASFSSWTFTGGAGKAYESGMSIFGMYWGAVLGLGFGYFTFAKRWRRTRSLTILEYLSERYDRNVHQFISWANTPVTIFQCAIWLYSLSIFIGAATHTPLVTVLLVCGLITLAYTMIGGLWGVCITDSLQFFILMPIAILVMILSVVAAGGFGEIVANTPPKFWLPFNQEAGITKMFVAFQFINGFFMFNSGGGAQRYFSSSDEREAAKVAGMSAILCFIGPFIWLTPAIACRSLYPHLGDELARAFGLAKPSEAAYVFISLKVLPHGLQGVLIAGILAATMSSLSAFYNMYSAVITKDIIGTVFIKNASSKFLHRLGMVVTLVMGLISILIAYFYSTLTDLGAFDLMIKVGSVLGIPVAVPIILGLVYKRTPTWVPYAVILIGMTIGAVFAIGNWEHYLGYELFQAVLYPLLCALFFIPGMFFSEEFGGSQKLKFWGKVLLYLLGLWYFCYGIFLYLNLPRIEGAGGGIVVDVDNLVWVQSLVYRIFTTPVIIVALAAAWAVMVETVSRLRIVPGRRYFDQVGAFFKKLDTPVDVKKEISEEFESRSADLSSFKILGVVMIIIGLLMGLFFLLDLDGREQLVTLASLIANLGLGLVLYWLGSRHTGAPEPADP